MPFKSWEKKPQRAELQEAVMQFMHCMSQGEFGKAFEVCPIFDYDNAALTSNGKEVQGEVNDPAEVTMIVDHLFDTLDAYGYFEDLDSTAPTPVKEDVTTWASHITTPSADSFDEYALYLFDDGLEVLDGGGQIDACTFVRGEISDITTVFHLKETDRGWFLNFKFMKVL
ncbi:hypothetical protein [Massilia antarctica]|uniref:hypothetical protein n=1 Tax=Massilia antarctica TaxID=2765360 RepID=UPI0006BB8C2A|nr:hypothetical protein [Massilia sp. H27-R4]MCY0910243.1 hypothetical protein [Massilia sp. H27-R4]CUI02658.1 hypothetical protein BN2497_93 [Janthinobacterium sp. CG23_2]CUU26444.1 hypothetical protein BN3177_93 [Janthinobacterium sp. CG23_2]